MNSVEQMPRSTSRIRPRTGHVRQNAHFAARLPGVNASVFADKQTRWQAQRPQALATKERDGRPPGLTRPAAFIAALCFPSATVNESVDLGNQARPRDAAGAWRTPCRSFGRQKSNISVVFCLPSAPVSQSVDLDDQARPRDAAAAWRTPYRSSADKKAMQFLQYSASRVPRLVKV